MCSMMKFSLCFLLMCISLGETILIMGPNSIRPNRHYTLVVSNVFSENKTDCLLTVRLEGIRLDGSSMINLTKSGIVKPDINNRITFNVPSNLTDGNYSLVIEGKQPSTSSGVNIYHTAKLSYHNSSMSSLIQLNKPIFKQDDILKFRVIVVDSDLKPPLSHQTTLSVHVYGPKGEVFREWTNVTLNQGVFANETVIPTIPVSGTYNISVTATGFSNSKLFVVRDFALYSIDLNIYPTVVPLAEHQALNLTVNVQNYMKKSVSGTMKIDLYLSPDDNKLDSSGKVEIHGKGQIYLPFNEKVVRDYLPTYDVLLKVTFTEQYSNQTTLKDERITVYNYKYKVTHDTKLTYRPGLPFTVTLKVTHLNGEPTNNVTLLVKIGGAGGFPEQSFTTNLIGYIKLQVETNETTKLSFLQVSDGKYLMLNETIYQLESADMYIEVKLLTRVKFNRMLRTMISCSHEMTNLLYYVISKGNIVDTGFFRPNHMNRYSFQVMVSARLIPRSRIVVATTVNNKTILSAVDIFINELGNPLEVNIEENISEDGVDPGDEIELAIRGRPGAFVALAAYDYRLQQHGKDHDIFLEDIWEMFNKFHQTDANAAGVISSAGLFVWISDKSITIAERNEYEARGMHPDTPRVGMAGPYRTEFWESWLWENVTVPSSGSIELVETVPHSATSWYITGFSIDSEYGLGIVKHPIRFSTINIFFILDHLPKSVKRYEAVWLHFTVFSTLNEAFEATVTMFNTKNQTQFVDENNQDTGEVTASKNVIVPANSDAPVSFLVNPMKLGELEIRLNASILQGLITDSFKKIIKVLPEDLKVQEGTNRTHIQHGTNSNTSYEIPLSIGKKGENGSIHVAYTVAPDPEAPENIPNNLSLSFHYGNIEEKLHINSEPKKNMSIEPILHHVKHFDVNVHGVGYGFFQVDWENRVNLMDYTPSFNLNMTKLATATKLLKQLKVCCSLISENKEYYASKTLVEISIPIGYAMDYHSVENATANFISRFEIVHDGTTLMVYYDSITSETTCFTVFAYRRYRMPVKRPSFIKVQDMKHPELNAIQIFSFY
ncbi:CD109 antigen-like [Anopheles albimanus]|uniref:Alpha-2-macroglobulin bait region domain-containing protein n=1 Tax=Anopheles albimanus TaxID=7167 RepID=A0A8W7JWB7_ANOAL|nr:CD109 antigen-like [Anopheles albimanus]